MSGPTSEYKMFSGSHREVEDFLTKFSKEGWKPILMSSAMGAAHVVTLVLELPAGGLDPDIDSP